MSHPSKNKKIANQIKRVLGISSDSSSSSGASSSSEGRSSSNMSGSRDPPSSDSSSSIASRSKSTSTMAESYLQARANARAAAAMAAAAAAAAAASSSSSESSSPYHYSQIPQHPPPPPPSSTDANSNDSKKKQLSKQKPPPPQTNDNKQVTLLSSEIASLLECPVCFETVLPPILQCENGHLVCQDCKAKITYCPTCRIPMGANIRNLQMEKLAGTIVMPCRYASRGCKEQLWLTAREEHEDQCSCRPYSCPCPSGSSCKWKGSIEEVMPHLTANHKTITTLEGEDIVFLATDINLSGAVDWVMIQSCFKQNFMLVLEKQERSSGFHQFHAVVQLIGSKKQSEAFSYRLELIGPRRRLLWEASPKSICDGVQKAIESRDCLTFDTTMAQLFSDGGNLGINVTIMPASHTHKD